MSVRHLVLYVDCDPSTLSRGVLQIRALGHTVVASSDATLAVSIAAKEPVTMIVLCHSIGSEQRQEMVRNLRFLRGSIPIVLCSDEGAMEYSGTELQAHPEPLENTLRRIASAGAF